MIPVRVSDDDVGDIIRFDINSLKSKIRSLILSVISTMLDCVLKKPKSHIDEDLSAVIALQEPDIV